MFMKKLTRVCCGLATAWACPGGRLVCRTHSQAVVDMLNECFGDFTYPVYCSLAPMPTEHWLGRRDRVRAERFCRFVRSRTCVLLCPEDLDMACCVDILTEMICSRAGVFFPKICRFCVDR